MQTLGFIAFGVVDLLVFSVVLTALIWAAVKDGQKQQTVETMLAASADALPAPRPAPQKTYRYKLAVAH